MNIPSGSSWDAIIRCLYYGEIKNDRDIGYGESQFGLFLSVIHRLGVWVICDFLALSFEVPWDIQSHKFSWLEIGGTWAKETKVLTYIKDWLRICRGSVAFELVYVLIEEPRSRVCSDNSNPPVDSRDVVKF